MPASWRVVSRGHNALSRTHVVGAIIDFEDVPALSGQLGRRILGEAGIDVSVDRNGIVVVNQDEIVQAKVTGEGDG